MAKRGSTVVAMGRESWQAGDYNWSGVLRAFQEFDFDGTGTIDRADLSLLLMVLGPSCFTEISTTKLLNAYDDSAGTAGGPIQYETFLDWCSRRWSPRQPAGAPHGRPPRHRWGASRRNAPGELQAPCKELQLNVAVHDEGGMRLMMVHASPFDIVSKVKERISVEMMAALGFNCAPVESQQLVLGEKWLQDADLLASCGLYGPDVRLQLVLLQPAPLQLLDFACVVAGVSSRSCEEQEVARALANAFCCRDVDAPLREGQSSARQTPTARPSDQMESLYGAERGTPLWNLPQIRAPPGCISAAAQWLLQHGASYEATHAERSITDQCFLHGNEPVLRAVLAVGAPPPTWEQVLQGLVTASHGMGRVVYSDLGFPAGGVEPDLSASARNEILARMGAEVDQARSLLAFVDMVSNELLPTTEMPKDLFARAALIGGAMEQELTLGEVAGPHLSFLTAAAHAGHCWVLAGLVHKGLSWGLSAKDKLRPGGLSPQWLASAAGALEAQCRAAVKAAGLRMALLRDGQGTSEGLLSTNSGQPSWSEGLLITATRCGASRRLLARLVADPQFDPNLGVHRCRDAGGFELLSPLGWLASTKGARSAAAKAASAAVELLAAHRLTDFEFGRIVGRRSRAECRLETPAFLMRRTGTWLNLLVLLRAGAPLPVSQASDPRLSCNGGDWREVDEVLPEDEWLDSLEQDLELRLKDCQRAEGAELRGARRLYGWLREVRCPNFRFATLSAFPVPFRAVAACLQRGLVQRPAPGRVAWPERPLELVLSFVPFWGFAAGRRNYLQELHLRRLDGYARSSGYPGCPVSEWELLLSGAQFRLGDWAEDLYRSRRVSRPAPVAKEKAGEDCESEKYSTQLHLLKQEAEESKEGRDVMEAREAEELLLEELSAIGL